MLAHHPGERVHRAGAPARAHRRRALQHARLCGRAAARGAGAVRPAFPGLPHLRHAAGPVRGRPRDHRGSHRQGARRLVRPGRRRSSISCATRSPSTWSAPGGSGHSIARVRRFAFKVQQFTGPMMAKSLEDTAFYRYHRLLALNEVGGDPACRRAVDRGFSRAHAATRAASVAARPDRDRDPRHQARRGCARAPACALRARRTNGPRPCAQWRSLNAGLIDAVGAVAQPVAGARIHALSGAARRLAARRCRTTSFVERMQDYAVKAAREGKQQTSWLAPERELRSRARASFSRRLLDPARSAAVHRSLRRLRAPRRH